MFILSFVIYRLSFLAMLKDSKGKIRRYMTKLYEDYNCYKEYPKNTLSFRFWNVVVLTASDDDQKVAYQMQINQKIKDKELISGVDYLVITDTKGPKIGCGGATMNVIFEMKKIYGEKFSKLYVLIINAGGFSQRLPCSSALGKIFMAIPFGSPMWTLFDLKLASYMPFLQRMQPGIFHAASDTIELFNIDEPLSDWDFSQKGMTAIAHPSSLEIGMTHGVFVPTGDLKGGRSGMASIMFLECSEVLQKPSLDVLKEKQAIVNVDDKDTILKEFLYTDSCFYIDHEFVEELNKFYIEQLPLTCEIDAYGDFMRCLGKNFSCDFKTNAKDTDNVKADSNLMTVREKLYKQLHLLQLNVLAFNESQFFHLGTMNEYLENLTLRGELFELMGWDQKAFVTAMDPSSNVEGGSTLMHSHFESKIKIKSQSVIEYCHFSSDVEIGDRCIISNCSIKGPLGFIVRVPSNLFIHTVPIIDGNTAGYVTMVFGIDDDIKRKYTDSQDILYMGKPLKNHPVISKLPSTSASLWDVELFPCLPDPTNSLLASLSLVTQGTNVELPSIRYSAGSLMKCKDVITMLKYRNDLKLDITNNLLIN